jgi:hypothetical protein
MSTEESLLEALTGNICLSGGADGADLHWGMNAGRDGQNVIHWSYEGHKSQAPKQEIVILSEEQLLRADNDLKIASKTLKRSWPGSRSQNVKSLLRRNWYQVRWSDSIYAVSSLRNDGVVNGGTGWAVQMFLDRHKKLGQFQALNAFVFDQEEKQWYQYIGGWKPIDAPPKPEGLWAGVGTRKINHAGKWAIRNLFGWFEE